MLLAFHLANFRSYRSPTSIFFEKRSLKTNHPKDGDWENATHRVSGIFGANAAGKSNVLVPLIQLNVAVQNSLATPFVLGNLRDPHTLSTPDEPSVFITDYVFDDIRYQWTVVLDNDGIVEEELSANPSGYWRRIFNRNRDSVTFGQKSGIPRSAQENIREFASPWALTMSAWTIVKSRGEFAGAADWWKTKLLSVEAGEEAQRIRHEWLKKMLLKPSWLQLVSIVARSADVGVDSIEIDEREVPEELREFVQRISKAMVGGETDLEDTKTPSLDSTVEKIQRSLRFTHNGGDGQFTLPEDAESLGTRAWIDTAIPAIYALITGGVLIVDEIDGSLHTSLVRQIIEFFSSSALNTSGAQLVFTSHDLSLLGNHPRPALHRESTWLAEKTNGESQLVTLDEFRLRDNNNFEKQYLQGAFGSLPNTSTTELARVIHSLRSDHLSGGAHE